MLWIGGYARCEGPAPTLDLPCYTYRYVPKPLNDRQKQVDQQIIALSWPYLLLLAREGWAVRRKQAQRIRRR